MLLKTKFSLDVNYTFIFYQVKKEQLKQEKLKKKEELKHSGDETPDVDNIANKLESVKLEPETASVANADASKPSPDVVKAEREAKKAAKAAAKASAGKNKKGSEPGAETNSVEGNKEQLTEEQEKKKAEKAKRKAEFEAKKAAEAAAKGEAASDSAAAKEGASGEKSKAELKAERRAKQEAQRLAKAQAQEQKKDGDNKNTDGGQKKDEASPSEQKKVEKKSTASNKPQTDVSKGQKVAPLFSHLHQYNKETELVNKLLGSSGANIHPSCVHLGLQLIDGQAGGLKDN